MKNIKVILIFITVLSCNDHQVRRSGFPLKTFTIGRLNLKLPGYYSQFIPKDSVNNDEIYFTIMDTVVLKAYKDFYGYLGDFDEYANQKLCQNTFDTIGDMLIFISTAEIDDPYNSFKRLENEISVAFFDLRKFKYDIFHNKIDSKRRYVLLAFRKASGCYLSKLDRNELMLLDNQL